MEQLLKSLQQKLDAQKYYQSAIAHQDLGGMMSYCDGCAFKKLVEKDRFKCNLEYKSVVENQVCAKNYRRNNNETRVESKPKATRKRSNGKG